MNLEPIVLILAREMKNAAGLTLTHQRTNNHGSNSTMFRWLPDDPEKKKPPPVSRRGLSFESLAVTYSGMPERHTTIGAERFHFRVRNGIGWFPLAIAARQTV